MPDLNIIPYPRKVKFHDGCFILDSTVKIINSDVSEFKLNYLKEIIHFYTGIYLEISTDSKDKHIKFFKTKLSPQNVDGSYDLIVTENAIEIGSESDSGFLYAIQTLSQLLPLKTSNQVGIPAVTIKDTPHFQWRGMHLDVSRHFFTVDEIKKYIDLIAMHKMNLFHWHLVDDQGWRIEIKQYPKLTEVGAWRKEPDGSTYGGFYTQDDIKKIVAYASEREITILPEIEMPGHSMAALAAYPEYSCSGSSFEVPNGWGIFDDV